VPRPRDADIRRRRLALVLVAVVSLVAGIATGAGAGAGDDRGEARAPRAPQAPPLPLATAVGQLLVVAFEGTDPPNWVERWLRRDQAAGVILFAGNMPDAATARRVTRGLQRSARRGALVSTDQEGGEIRTLAFAPPAAAQSDLSTPSQAADGARRAAGALKAAGINVNLAPVVDVTEPGSALSGRGYPGGSGDVSRLAAAATTAYGRAGVAATAKHFPGLGRAAENTDDAGVTIDAARADLERTDLPPFAAAVDAGTPLVMAGHAIYPAFDSDRIASQSPVLLREVLRGTLGFNGVVVTDSIEAEAALARSGVAEAAERSVAAGCDLVLMTGSGSWREVYPRLLRRARRDRAFAATVRRSAARVVALKRRLGLRVPG
jgi:beta-N-acetylhexosaminidase